MIISKNNKGEVVGGDLHRSARKRHSFCERKYHLDFNF